jgi:hypothetical protein
LTPRAPRRVMPWLSPRLVRLVKAGSIVACFSCARPALAQIPAYTPHEAPPAEAAASAPETATPALPASAPPAAKAVVITEQHAPAQPRDDDVDDAALQARTRPHWYGWQTLVADGATLSVFLASGVVGNGDERLGTQLAVLGLASYELTPGIIHFVHGNPGRGFASMGIRLGMPLTGAFVGATAASGCDGFLCEASGAAVGLLLGAAGAIAIDAAVFAYDDPKLRSSSRLSLRPLVSVTPQRAIVGLMGQL